MNKDELRIFFKKRRDGLFLKGEIERISASISNKIITSGYFQKAKNIMLFYPKKSELNVLELMKTEGKNFYLPVCRGNELDICPYRAKDELFLNKYKIYEPKTLPIDNLSIIDIVITPALCASKEFYRVGYGGGYYDRLFNKKDLKAVKIVIIPDEMLLDYVPYNEFDKYCNVIVTEKRIIERKEI